MQNYSELTNMYPLSFASKVFVIGQLGDFKGQITTPTQIWQHFNVSGSSLDTDIQKSASSA